MQANVPITELDSLTITARSVANNGKITSTAGLRVVLRDHLYEMACFVKFFKHYYHYYCNN